MKNLFTEEQLRELLLEPEFHVFETFLYGKSLKINKAAGFPDIWKGLVQDENSKVNISNYWLSAGSNFKYLAAMLEKKVQQLVIAKLRGEMEYSLLYFFLDKGKLRTWIGKKPIYILPFIFSELRIDLSPLYKIHNGFYNFSFGEPGIIPVEEVEIYKNPDVPELKGFLKLFQQGTSEIGLDLDSEDNQACIIWGSDEEVEEIESIWTELDKWLANIVEEYDDVIDAG